MRCVAQVGYSKASIREIARSAEVSSAALYNYFATKSDLLTAAVNEIEEVALPRLRAAGAATVTSPTGSQRSSTNPVS